MEKLKVDITDRVNAMLVWLFDSEQVLAEPYMDEDDILSRHPAEIGDRFDYLADK